MFQTELERNTERAMEGLRRGFGSGSAMAAVMVLAFVLVMVPEASATRFTVGGNKGWTTNVNYTIWAQDKHFYNGDWLCKLSYSLFGLSFRSNLLLYSWKFQSLVQFSLHFKFEWVGSENGLVGCASMCLSVGFVLREVISFWLASKMVTLLEIIT